MKPLAGIRRAREALCARRQPLNAAALPPAISVFPWRLTRRLASGGPLALHRVSATNECGPGCYVLKSLPSGQSNHEFWQAMLTREAAVASEVSHPNLISVLASEMGPPRPYIVLPYLEGTTLWRVINWQSASSPSPKLPAAFALCLVRQVAAALASMHSAGWLHGQVRPEHVIVSPQGQATLIDLSQSRRLESSECEVVDSLPVEAQHSAPEMFSSRDRLTPAADTYSLGVTLYEALAGQPPFVASSPRQLLACHRRQAPPDLRQLRSDLSLEIAQLARRMLAKEPLRRPSDEELVRWLAELEIEELSA